MYCQSVVDILLKCCQFLILCFLNYVKIVNDYFEILIEELFGVKLKLKFDYSEQIHLVECTFVIKFINYDKNFCIP